MRAFNDEWIHRAGGFIPVMESDGLTVKCILRRIAPKIGLF
jgi:hypothetical protein